MKSTISTKWIGDMAFESDVNGHKIRMDASEAVGGHDSGVRPKPLMLVALAGCTAMDTVSILKKMRVTQNIEDFWIDVEGDMTEEHPKQYSAMTVIYKFKAKEGKKLSVEKLEKAVSLSQEKYCGVSALYQKVISVKHEIQIVN